MKFTFDRAKVEEPFTHYYMNGCQVATLSHQGSFVKYLGARAIISDASHPIFQEESPSWDNFQSQLGKTAFIEIQYV